MPKIWHNWHSHHRITCAVLSVLCLLESWHHFSSTASLLLQERNYLLLLVVPPQFAIDFSKVLLSINMLGWHCMPWATTALIHAETKSGYSGLYSEYKAANTATNFMLTLPNCRHKECQRCYYNKELNNYQVIAAAMRFKCNASLWPWQIEKQLGENNTSFQFFL